MELQDGDVGTCAASRFQELGEQLLRRTLVALRRFAEFATLWQGSEVHNK